MTLAIILPLIFHKKNQSTTSSLYLQSLLPPPYSFPFSFIKPKDHSLFNQSIKNRNFRSRISITHIKNLVVFQSPIEMGSFLKTILFSCILASVFASSSAQNCNSSYAFNNNNIYATCVSLPVQNSFLHWTYHQANHTADIAYRHTGVTDSQWVCWALNIGGRGMVGSQCLIAFTNSSGLVQSYTTQVSSYTPSMQPGDLSFNVRGLTAERRGSDMIIFASLDLPTGRTSFTQVWQVGSVSGDTLNRHALNPDNTNSIGTLDFSSGQTTTGGGSVGGSRQRRRNVHGVLNAVSWGVLLPLGAMAARYLKVFKAANPAWFYLHAACQTSAYIIGVAGWATGLKLGSDSVGIEYNKHRNIGITLFTLGTLQVFALLLRPKPDHKFRFYWKIYHHAVGYVVIGLSIANVFEGLDILDPQKKWKRIYIGILIFLGATSVILEAFTWFIVSKRGKEESDKHQHLGNGTNGVNGYGANGA